MLPCNTGDTSSRIIIKLNLRHEAAGGFSRCRLVTVHVGLLPRIIFRGVCCVLPSKLPSRPAVCDTRVRAPGLTLSCRCQAFLRGLLGAIPVTSSGVNLLEDSYQLHVMFAFSPQFRQLPHRRLNTLLSATLEGHFYLTR